jgi:hypothetical protein
MSKQDDDLSHGFDRGNYANAYETENFDAPLVKADLEGESDAYVAGYTLGFFATYEPSEMGQWAAEYEACFMNYAKRMTELGIAV